MMKDVRVQNCCLILLALAVCSFAHAQTSVVEYVHPLIGTAPSQTISALRHGSGTENNAQVIPSVTMPNGMTNWTPQTRTVEAKCVAPYYYVDTVLNGFRGSHWLNGSCTQDYGSVTVMPMNTTRTLGTAERGSRFTHAREVSTPYYYKAVLDDYNIIGEVTSTTRTGLLRFTFHNTDTAVISVAPNSDYNEGYVHILTARNEIVGYNPVHRIYQGWGEKAGFRGYFVARFDRAITSSGTYQNTIVLPGDSVISSGARVGGYAAIALNGSPTVVVRVGTSFTSIDEARKNLDAESQCLSFDEAKALLMKQWTTTLSKIDIGGAPDDEKIKFYTALYHSFLQPRLYNDCDGSYPGFGGNAAIHNSGTRDYFDDFSMWDTYRALQPLYTILTPGRSADMVRSLITKGHQGGWLPIFPCWNSYTSAMIGDHAIAAIADAYMKKMIDLTEDDYQLLKKNATQTPEKFSDYVNGKGRRALQSYMKYGYIPLEDSVKESFHRGEQVSRTLEYAYDDFALSQIAQKMGKTVDAGYFLARSKNYTNVFDPAVQSVRGKHANGSFTETFIKTERMSYITEGTPWQYTWYVPQDVEGLIALMGGRDSFNRNLDEFFAARQYWHGNEPGHQIPFLYTYSGQPWKSREIIANILKEEYSTDPGGLSGNDDSGQMSAWYVFGAIGMYPVCPAKNEYAVSGPMFEHVSLHLENGKTLVLTSAGLSEGKTRVKAIRLNGVTLDRNIVSHADVMNGGTVDFIMER